MKEYYGNYLGLCINNDDPEKRGRVQIFIPHIMPSLFQDWNEVGEDIKLLCIGDNLPDSLPAPVVERLMKILPWAEAASPILGTSSPGNLITNAIDAFGNAIGNFFNQSPTATPNQEGNLGNALEPVNLGRFSSTLQKGGNPAIYPFWDSIKSKYPNVKDYGIWGDASHQQRKSDHNTGDAIDVGINNVNEGTNVFNDIIASGGRGQFAGSVKYAIFNGQIWSPEKGLRPYTGSNPHSGHVHVSFNRGASSARSSLFDNDKNNPYETTSTSGQVASLLPHQSPNPLGEGSLFGSIANPFAGSTVSSQASIAQGVAPTLGGSSSTTTIDVDGNGRVNPEQLKAYLVQRISNSRLNGFVPRDGAKYGVDGTPQSWANHFVSLAKHESSFYVTSTNNRDAGGSLGLFQVSVFDGSRYRANPTGQNWTEQQLRNPINNTNTAIAIYERNVLKTGVIADPVSGKGAWTGNGTEGYFATTSMNKIARDAATGQLGSFDPNALPSQSMSMVNQTDRGGATPVLNLNNMAKGVFTYPAAGAVLWVFFREGNPLFPVYFAANYGQREWESAFRQGSDAPKYKPAATPANPVISTGGIMNLGGVGAITWEDTTDPTNNKNNQKSIMIGGHDGSNMFFNDGFHQIFSKFDRRDQVEGDRFNTTLGTKEEWIQSDSNSVVMGDQYIKVGNISPDVIEATRRIQDIMKDIMAPLAKSTVTGQNRRPGGPANSKFTKQAQTRFQRTGIPKGPFSIPAQSVLQNLTDTLLAKFNLRPTPQSTTERMTTNDAGVDSKPVVPPTPPASPSQL